MQLSGDQVEFPVASCLSLLWEAQPQPVVTVDSLLFPKAAGLLSASRSVPALLLWQQCISPEVRGAFPAVPLGFCSVSCLIGSGITLLIIGIPC